MIKVWIVIVVARAVMSAIDRILEGLFSESEIEELERDEKARHYQ